TGEDMYTRRVLELLPRRTLVPAMLHKPTWAPESAPSPASAPQSLLQSKYLQTL
ncbi:hypothetical protein ACH5RR_027382, partial [Cinchona calisaya]